jgi:hypothetical protein
MPMKIHVIKGIHRKGCKCGSWLDHWRRFSGQAAPTCCPEHSCNEKLLVGSHVQDADPDYKNLYILPLCAKHGRATGMLTVDDSCEQVSANVSATCGLVPQPSR